VGALINREAGGPYARGLLDPKNVTKAWPLNRGGVHEATGVLYRDGSGGVMKALSKAEPLHGPHGVYQPGYETVAASVSNNFGQLPSSTGGAIHGPVPETVVGLMRYGDIDDIVSVQRWIEPGVKFQGKTVDQFLCGREAVYSISRIDQGEINTAAVLDAMIGAKDRHWKNVGVARTTDGKYHAVAIDNGYSFHPDPGRIRAWNKSKFATHAKGSISQADKDFIKAKFSNARIDALPIAKDVRAQMKARRKAILKMQDYADLISLWGDY
jgi:hypothetical protein